MQSPRRDLKAELRAKRMKELEAYSAEDEVISSQELQAYYLATKGAQTYTVKTGIPTLDRKTEGVQAGELVVISGPTKNGKTELAKTITVNMAADQNANPPLWISYEVPPRQFLNSFPRGVVPFFWLPKQLHANNLDWLEDRCLESHVKHGTRVIFIDHLHFLFDMARMRNSSLEIGACIRRVKRFAVEFDFAIFLIAHIGKIDPGERPRIHNLRDSSFVAQEADTVWMLWRELDENGQIGSLARVSIEVHRRTGVMGWEIPLMLRDGVLVEREESPTYQQPKSAAKRRRA